MTESRPPELGNGSEPAEDDSTPRDVSKQFLYTTIVDLGKKVDRLGGEIQTLTRLMSQFVDGLGEVRTEARNMGAAVMASQKESAEILTKFEHMVSRVRQEITAAYAAGREGRPLETVPPPPERNTEPDIPRFPSSPPDDP